MSLQLYQVDQKNYLLDFKSLDTVDHPDAARVKRMTKASMSAGDDNNAGRFKMVTILLCWTLVKNLSCTVFFLNVGKLYNSMNI